MGAIFFSYPRFFTLFACKIFSFAVIALQSVTPVVISVISVAVRNFLVNLSVNMKNKAYICSGKTYEDNENEYTMDADSHPFTLQSVERAGSDTCRGY